MLTYWFYAIILINGRVNRVLLTGASGTLGKALSAVINDYPRYNAYSCWHGFRSSRNDLCFDGDTFVVDVENMAFDNIDHRAFPVEDTYFSTDISKDTVHATLVHYVLINAIGVCCEGNSMAAASESVRVNALAPLVLARDFIQDGRLCAERGEDTMPAVTIINISSGEGELAFLHTDLARLISEISSLSDWFQFANSLVENPTFWLERSPSHDSCIEGTVATKSKGTRDVEVEMKMNVEIAFGSSPWYSVSKALLNRGTRLLHEEMCLRISRESGGSCMRAIALCPGDFSSNMSTDEERSRIARSHVGLEEICHGILSVVDDPDGFPGGHFYRPSQSGNLALPW